MPGPLTPMPLLPRPVLPGPSVIAPDGARISVPYTGTPLDQVHLAASLDHYMSTNYPGSNTPNTNSLSSLDIARNPVAASAFAASPTSVMPPVVPIQSIVPIQRGPVAPTQNIPPPMQRTAPPSPVSAPVSPAPRPVSPFVTTARPALPLSPPGQTGQRAVPGQSVTPAQAPSAAPPRSVPTVPATLPLPVQRDELHKAVTIAPGDLSTLSPQDRQAAQTALNNIATSDLHFTHLLQRGQATAVDAAERAATYQKNLDALQKTAYRLMPEGIKLRNWATQANLYKPPAPPATAMPAGVARPTGPMVPYQSQVAPGAASGGPLAGFDRFIGADGHEGTFHQGLNSAGQLIGTDIFGTGPHRGAFGLFGQGLLETGDLAMKLVGEDPAQYMQPTPEAASYVALNSQKQAMRGAVAGSPGLVMPAGTTDLLPAASQTLTGHGPQARKTLASVPGQMKDAFDETKPGGNPLAAGLSYVPVAGAAARLFGGLGTAARIGGDIGRMDLTPTSAIKEFDAAHAPGPAVSPSPSVGQIPRKGPATSPSLPKRSSATPASTADTKLANQIAPGWQQLTSGKPSPGVPKAQTDAPILNVATMPGSAKGQVFINVVNMHRDLMQRVINPKTGGLYTLEKMGIPHKVLTTEGTSTTQAWGQEPNMHIALPGADIKTARYIASLLGKSFGQDGVGIHLPVSPAEALAAKNAIANNSALPDSLHRVASVSKSNGSTWAQPEIDAINKVAQRYNVELQTTPDGKGIEFHDYGSAFDPDPVKAGQDWQRRVNRTLADAGLETPNYTLNTSITKSQYVDQSNYRRHLGTSGTYPRTNPGGHRPFVLELSRDHRNAFRKRK